MLNLGWFLFKRCPFLTVENCLRFLDCMVSGSKKTRWEMGPGYTFNERNPGSGGICSARLLLGVGKNSGFSPQIIHFNRVFHYFHHPFWGTPIFGNTHIKPDYCWVLATQIVFIFNPDPWGFMIQFDEHIFQMGWFNHQLDWVDCHTLP